MTYLLFVLFIEKKSNVDENATKRIRIAVMATERIAIKEVEKIFEK